MTEVPPENKHSLSHLLKDQPPKPIANTAEDKTELSLKRFSNRVRHKSRGHNQYWNDVHNVIMADSTVQNYLNYLKGVRNNNGVICFGTQERVVGAVRNFLDYVDIPITDHAMTDLIQAKRKDPTNTDIENAILAFANEPPYVEAQSQRASMIVAIFKRGNFVPLMVRINTHFTPKQKENCSWQKFREIYATLTQEQQAMVQWGLYVPQRAKATYRVALDKIDLSRPDYAIVTIEPTVGINKARVRHPDFVPISFARDIVGAAKAAGRTCPFPNHESEWKKITAIAKQQYGVHLLSKNLRKFFVKAANQSRLRPDIAAFVMGDKTKLNLVAGHMPLVYDPDLMESFWSEMANEITQSGITNLLTISNTAPTSRLDQINEQIAALREEAQRLKIQ